MKTLVLIGMMFAGSMVFGWSADGKTGVYEPNVAFRMQERATDKIRSLVERKYPGARILDRDTDNGLLEVKIRHDGIEKIVLFNREKQWLRTVWETRRSRLPKRVLRGLDASGFPYERVDDNDNMVMENSDGRFYAVQVERGNEDYILVVSAAGKILHRFFDDEWDDGRWDRNEDIYDDWDENWDADDWEWGEENRIHDDGEDHFDEGDDEWHSRSSHHSYRHRDRDDGEDHFDEGDDEWDDRDED